MAETNTIEKIKDSTDTKEPKFYKIVLHNDNVTTMDFVIFVLTTIFHKSVEDSFRITMDIHTNGTGVAGMPYTKEIAEEKLAETLALSVTNGYPLVATMEEL